LWRDAAFLSRFEGPTFGSTLKIGILNVSEKEGIPGEHVGIAVDAVMSVKLADKADRFLVGQTRSPPFQPGYSGQSRMIRDKIHLLVHPDVIVDVWLFVDAARWHGEQPERDHHLVLDARLFGFPIRNALHKSIERIPGTLFARHFVQVAFENNPGTAIDNCPDEVGPDHFLV